ncbi:MAG: hypothetical protein GX767_09035, partial [Firmicutes bacterium]|nr:hypothetical protein [Bacillota bacterium]
MKKTLITISSDSKNRDEIYNQLTELIGDLCTIKSLSCKELTEYKKLQGDLILISVSFIEKLVLPYISSSSKVIVARRTINMKNLKKLFDIPPDSDVLIVNNSYDTSKETINELHEIGIKHLHFYPYDPDRKQAKKFNYAVTFGESHLVPENIPNVLDMGTRLIDIMTIAEILFYFEGAINCNALISSRYVRKLVQLSMELSEQIKQNEMLHRQLKL